MGRGEIVHPAQDARVGSCTSPSGVNTWFLPR
jgi:hypothetical protein